MRTRLAVEEVLFTEDSFLRLDRSDVRLLITMAVRNKRKRMRLCAHKNPNEKLQEMFIVHTKDTYVRPHKHTQKEESLHVLEGEADLLIFNEKGTVTEVFRLGDYGSGHLFYYRIPAGVYHSLRIQSEFFIFHESTTGPFIRSESVPAPWSPDEEDRDAVLKFLARKCEILPGLKGNSE
jgi:cupin fold WbuC family metalloprotein